ncbi:MAG: hypothetical protein NTW17_00725 [Candidatus Pacearchaeota archaeon]|nr:hypothetical protein [Candidatus Pacearchaeota archaeon]
MFVGVDPPADILYTSPSDKPGIFYGEACHKVDDESARAKVRRSEIKDPILLGLLSGKTIGQIVRRYEPCLRNQHHLCKRGEQDISRRLNSRTFEITEEQEEELVSA